jgi:hypothetical protein
MKKQYLIYSLFIATSLFFLSCDKIENPVLETNAYLESEYGPAPTFSIATTPHRNVFFLEFTGHLCGYCPPATAALKTWDEEQGENLVVMAVHAGTLAEPSSEPFQTDYRTESGDLIWSHISGGFNPGGLADKFPIQTGEELLGWNSWQTKIQQAAAVSTPAVLQLKAEYISENKHLNVHANTQFLEAAAGNYSVLIYLVESNIISPQEDYSQDPTEILDYEHNHVLRAPISQTFGDAVVSNPSAGSNITKSYTYSVRNNWVMSNCTVVAALVDNATGNVVNAAEVELN